MSVRVLRVADRVPTAWKNGGGVTREVTAFPPGAGMENFDWRVSIADIYEASAFSTFGGVDRTLMVLEGMLRLAVDRREPLMLSAGEQHPFTGEAGVDGTPIGGPVRDLNVMVRRGKWRGAMKMIQPVGSAYSLAVLPNSLIIVTGPAIVEWAAGKAELTRLDGVLVYPATSDDVELSSLHPVIAITLTPVT